MKVKIAGRAVKDNKVHVIGAERTECAAGRDKTTLEMDVMGYLVEIMNFNVY